MFAKITDHAVRALARLLTQFRTSLEVQGITNALSSEVQALENAIYGVLAVRDVATATGATLESIGKLVGAPPRGTWDNDEYRKRVHVQILINKSSGTAADLVGIATAFKPAWAGPDILVKTREGGPTSAGYLSGSPVDQVAHSGSVEIVCVPDINDGGADSTISGDEARELTKYLKSAAVGGVRPIFVYRNTSIGVDNAFRFSGGTPPETPAGFGSGGGMLFNALDK